MVGCPDETVRVLGNSHNVLLGIQVETLGSESRCNRSSGRILRPSCVETTGSLGILVTTLLTKARDRIEFEEGAGGVSGREVDEDNSSSSNNNNDRYNKSSEDDDVGPAKGLTTGFKQKGFRRHPETTGTSLASVASSRVQWWIRNLKAGARCTR